MFEDFFFTSFLCGPKVVWVLSVPICLTSLVVWGTINFLLS